MNYRIPPLTFRTIVNHLHAGLPTHCLPCGHPFHLGAAAWAMTLGAEVIGYICPRCLSAEARERLAEAERATFQ